MDDTGDSNIDDQARSRGHCFSKVELNTNIQQLTPATLKKYLVPSSGVKTCGSAITNNHNEFRVRNTHQGWVDNKITTRYIKHGV